MTKSGLPLLMMLALAVGAAPATAGTYVVKSCGSSGVNNAWRATPAPPEMEVNDVCAAATDMDGIWIRDVLGSSTDIRDGEGAWLRVDAAAGTRIVGIKYRRRLWKVASDDAKPELRTGEGVVLETCSIVFGQLGCSLGGDGTEPVAFTGLDTARLEAGVRCDISEPWAEVCTGGGTRHGYGAQIFDAEVTIEDAAAPAAPELASSGLWSGATWHHGISGVEVSATDASGIRAVRLYADGELVSEVPLACDWSRPAPCSALDDEPIEFDTTAIPDGRRQLAVTALDAGDNESPPRAREVVIANAAPAAPQLTLTPGRSTNPNFQAAWTSTHPVPIARAFVTACTGGNCTTTPTTQSS